MKLRKFFSFVILAIPSTIILGSGFTLAQDVWVNGYYRFDGTYIKGHYQSRTNGYSGNSLTQSSQEYLGRLSSNPYDSESTSNPYGKYGSPYSPTSINNPYGRYGSPYSPNSVTNPYSTSSPKIVAQDGKYLGRLSSNPYDPESTSNPYGKYGSSYTPTSINNPYSVYGSSYSPLSPTNPYTLNAPSLLGQ